MEGALGLAQAVQPVRYSSLPGRPFPGPPTRYPTRDEVADYLTDYAAHFDLPVELGRHVRSISRGGRGYILDTKGRSYEAEQVVVATGPFQVPFVPAIASELDPEVTQLHSSAYRSPEQIGSGRVLVVGGGTRGFRSPPSLRERMRRTSRSARATRRFPSASSAATCSGT